MSKPKSSEIVFALMFLLGGLLGWFLFRDERNAVLAYLGIIGSGAILMAVVDLLNGKLEKRPLLFVRRTIHYVSVLFINLLILVVLLPIIIVQLILGPAALFGMLLGSIISLVCFAEEVVGWDLVAVDLKNQEPHLWQGLLLFGVSLLALFIGYLVSRYELQERLIDMLADGLSEFRLDKILSKH